MISHQDECQKTRYCNERFFKTDQSQKQMPLATFFEPVRTATQRKRPPFSLEARSLTADIALIFDRSLVTPDKPCTNITNTTDVLMA